MKQHIMPQSAIPLPGTDSIHSNAELVASRLLRALGGQVCYLSLVGNGGSYPRMLLAVSSDSSPVKWTREISPLLRKSRSRSAPYWALLCNQQVLALPLITNDHSVGAAVLTFTAGQEPQELAKVAAAAELAAEVLDVNERLEHAKFKAEAIAEHARVREIQLSRNLLRGVIDSIPLGLLLLDTDGTVLAANRSVADRVGLDPATLVGMQYSLGVSPWADSPAGETFTTHKPAQLRRTLQRADGGQQVLEISSFPLFDTEGKPRQVVEVWEDITERVSLHTQLIRAEKLAAIGQLAASIAHEVGNPLQAIQGFLDLFLEEAPADVANRFYLELAEEEIERIVHVVARLRDLYRPSSDISQLADINALVDHVLLLTHKQMEQHGIRCERALEPEAPHLSCVADQIKQVLLNLVLNAIDAMKGRSGTLTVRTVVRREADVSVLDIVVGDTGVGIPSPQLPQLFDGLQTTKEGGMGLGLYTSKAIIERHMGRINVESVVGKGTTFTITLPLV